MCRQNYYMYCPKQATKDKKRYKDEVDGIKWKSKKVRQKQSRVQHFSINICKIILDNENKILCTFLLHQNDGGAVVLIIVFSKIPFQ